MSIGKVVEKFGIYFDEIGLNKTYGRMFGLFMTIEEPISMGRLVTELQISKSTASIEIRRLLTMGYIEKVLVSDQRADFYQLKKDVWVIHFLQKMQMIISLEYLIIYHRLIRLTLMTQHQVLWTYMRRQPYYHSQILQQ